MASTTTSVGAGGSDDNTTLAAITHILALFTWLIGPLVVFLVTDDEFVKANARAAINWQIWFTIYSIVAGVLIIVGIGILLPPLLGLLNMVFIVIAAVKAAEGEVWSYRSRSISCKRRPRSLFLLWGSYERRRSGTTRSVHKSRTRRRKPTYSSSSKSSRANSVGAAAVERLVGEQPVDDRQRASTLVVRRDNQIDVR